MIAALAVQLCVLSGCAENAASINVGSTNTETITAEPETDASGGGLDTVHGESDLPGDETGGGTVIQIGDLAAVTVPASWNDTCFYSVGEESVAFFELFDYETFPDMGTRGHLVTVRLLSEDEEPMFTNYEYLGFLTTQSGSKYSAFACYPTEPQIGPIDWGGRPDVYSAMSARIPALLESLRGVNGNVFTPAA